MYACSAFIQICCCIARASPAPRLQVICALHPTSHKHYNGWSDMESFLWTTQSAAIFVGVCPIMFRDDGVALSARPVHAHRSRPIPREKHKKKSKAPTIASSPRTDRPQETSFAALPAVLWRCTFPAVLWRCTFPAVLWRCTFPHPLEEAW